MPSKSKAQQRFFGMVDAYKKGKMKNPSSKIKKAAKGMSMSDVKDFAETKHKGLPEKVEENMEKKVIRLTESDLHRIVKESVNKILTELDWKTYASAADKARERGNVSYWREKGDNSPKGSDRYWNMVGKASDERLRSNRFGDAAKDTFNRDFGYQQGKPYDNDYQRVGMGGDFGSTEEFSPHAVGYKSKGYGNPKKYEFGRDNDTFKSVEPEEFFNGNDDAAKAYHNANDEIKNWKKGNYEYQKGKGWQKK